MFTRVDRYVLRQAVMPFLTTLSIAALLLLLERMLRLFDFVINQGGPVEVVFRLLANAIPQYIALGLPVGLFLGVLIAFRKLSLNSELDALRASGLGIFRLLRPTFGLAGLLAAVNFSIIGFIYPYAEYNYWGLVFDLRSGALGASIKVGEFVRFGDDFVLRIEESRDQGSELVGVFLERESDDGQRYVVTANRGGFFSTPDQSHVILRLFDGVLVDLEETQSRPRVLSFDVQDLQIRLPDFQPFRPRGEGQRELTIFELYDLLDDRTIDEELRTTYRAHFHYRVMRIVMLLVLPFLAAALGVTRSRSDKSLGIVVGVTILIVFNELAEVGEALAATGTVSPYISLWGLMAGLTALSLRLFYILAYRVGGEPLRGLERAWAYLMVPVDWAIERLRREMA